MGLGVCTPKSLFFAASSLDSGQNFHNSSDFLKALKKKDRK